MEDFEEYSFAFELLNSDDSRIITLVCSSPSELYPEMYADTLIAYAERIRTLMEFNEVSNGVAN